METAIWIYANEGEKTVKETFVGSAAFRYFVCLSKPTIINGTLEKCTSFSTFRPIIIYIVQGIISAVFIFITRKYA